ncbi:MAG: hypothetical protein JSS79_07675 [Bacteroidetes bacterium]|nr:hypothetical protein [Bacteroidota bacterium]
MKVEFKITETVPKCQLTLYNSLSRIPFHVRIGDYSPGYSVLYSRNYHDGNLIEFRFDSEVRRLVEISLVSFNRKSVELTPELKIPYAMDELHECLLPKDIKGGLLFSQPVKILRSEDTVCIAFGSNDLSKIQYHSLNANCILGVTTESHLVSFVLTGLNKGDIHTIFGF